MGASKEQIRGWLERGKESEATHLIVVCNTFDWDDYPVFFTGDPETARRKAEGYNSHARMTKLMEVYRLNQDWDVQLNAARSFNY